MKIIVCGECGVEVEVDDKARRKFCIPCAEKRESISKLNYHKNRMNNDKEYYDYIKAYSKEWKKRTGYNSLRHKNMPEEQKKLLIEQSKQWHKRQQIENEEYRENKRIRTNKSRLKYKGSKEHYLKDRYNAIKAKCKKDNIPFDITHDYLLSILTDRCPYLGVTLTFANDGDSIFNGASVDRIDPRKGYVVGNVEIISRKANTMKSNALECELVVFAYNILEKFVDEARARIEMLAPKLLELLKNDNMVRQIAPMKVIEGETC